MMKQVIVYISMSLDGFIADKNGKVDWLCGDGSDVEHPGSYNTFFRTVDTIIMGYTTYHQIVTELSPQEWVYPGKKCFVLSHKNHPPTTHVQFTDQKLSELISILKAETEGRIWICGGASLINQLIELDCIDQYCITIIPTILGDGIRLFSTHGKELPLKLISTYSYNGMTDLIYERRK